MTDWREHHRTAEMEEERLASLLTAGTKEDKRAVAADAEFRLRQHRAILDQAEAAERTAEAAERQAVAAERAADAARSGADATIRYTRYTFWIMLATATAAAAAALGLLLGD